MKLLLIHNHNSHARDINEFLSEKGFRIVTVDDFDSVKKVFDARQYLNLVVADFDHDRDLVYDVLIFLRNNEQYVDTPVILIARSKPDELLEKCLAFDKIYLYDEKWNRESFSSVFEKAAVTCGKTIMLVDDEEMVRDVLKNTLQREGFNVIEASSGEQAVRLLEDNEVDLVISDIQMPAMSGKELLETVKANHGDIPFYLISGYMGDCTNEDLLQSGADGLIAKPFKYSEIVKAVREGLERIGVDNV